MVGRALRIGLNEIERERERERVGLPLTISEAEGLIVYGPPHGGHGQDGVERDREQGVRRRVLAPAPLRTVPGFKGIVHLTLSCIGYLQTNILKCSERE